MLKEIVKLCELGRFNDALRQINEVILKGNSNSELYRIKGQVELELGQVDESINSLIECLSLDSTNQSGLVLIGNIYAIHKEDIETAKKYYSQVLDLNTDNHIALTNIGGIIAKAGRFEEAEEYFTKALLIEPDYPNSIYALALTLYNKDKYTEAFSRSLEALLKIQSTNDPEAKKLYNQASNLLIEIAKKIVKESDYTEIYESLIQKLEISSGKKIDVNIDSSIATPAKFEIAENHNRDRHKLIIKEKTSSYAYYVMHELMHLQLIVEARAEDANEIFVSTHENEENFKAKFDKYLKVMSKAGLNANQKETLRNKLYNGLNLQIYNAPIDLIIEQRLYDSFPVLRAVQLLGLLEIANPSVQGAKDKSIKKIVPPFIRDTNIILSTTLFLQIKELYAIDLTDEISDKHLVKKGQRLYKDFEEIRDDKSAGEEYDMIRWWADELNLTSYFELKKEGDKPVHKKEYLPEELIQQLENDPYNLSPDVEWEEEQMKKFKEARKEEGINMAVVFYMLDAMNHFNDLKTSKIKEIGFEIATLGESGIDPNKKDTYNLSTVSKKKFTGWMLLSWMYVSWMDFEPKMARQMGLEFDQEYELAKSML